MRYQCGYRWPSPTASANLNAHRNDEKTREKRETHEGSRPRCPSRPWRMCLCRRLPRPVRLGLRKMLGQIRPNRMLLAIAAALLMLSVVQVSAQSQLPGCPGTRGVRWHMCVGTFTDPDDGERYVGEWRDNQRTGRGSSTYPNGDRYVGEYLNGRRHEGTYTWTNGNRYVGGYRNGQRNGQGTFTYANGAGYDGEYQNDQFNGRGAFTFLDGSRYIGEWRDNKYHGQGSMFSVDGRLLQNGVWQNDRLVQTNNLPTPIGTRGGSVSRYSVSLPITAFPAG